MNWQILIAYLAGTATTFVIMLGVIKYYRKANAYLMAENDYYYVMNRLFYKTLHSLQQKEVDESIEMRKILLNHKYNIDRVRRTGKY